jgi:hypothetical protein
MFGFLGSLDEDVCSRDGIEEAITRDSDRKAYDWSLWTDTLIKDCFERLTIEIMALMIPI